MAKKIKVLIVDDSAPMRLVLKEILNQDNEIEVVGAANDPFEAREMIKTFSPDVLTLDVEMPKMDGLTFLENLMRLRPMPVIMISTLTQARAETTLRALELGAFDYLPKPAIQSKENLYAYSDIIIEKVKAAFHANLQNRSKSNALAAVKGSKEMLRRSKISLITIGASTGGTEAIKDVLLQLPVELPPIVITQHIPPVFSASYAKRLDDMLPFKVCEVQMTGESLNNGHIYIAPGDKHLMVIKKGNKYYTQLSDAPPVNRHCPAVDVLFDSVADQVQGNVIGVILTGMGVDGAKGLKRLKDKGHVTIAQDEKTSVVWGMPSAAIREGAVDFVLPLQDIAKKITEVSYRK